MLFRSDSSAPYVETDYHCALQTLVGDGFVPAAMGRAPQDKPSTAAQHGCTVIPNFGP